MATYTGHYLVIDDFPSGGSVYSSGPINVLGEAEYVADDLGSGSQPQVGDTIDGAAILALSYVDDGTDSAGTVHSNGAYPFALSMGDGTTILSTDNDDHSETRMLFIQLADGRNLVSLSTTAFPTTITDEVVANGSGIEQINLNPNSQIHTGHWGSWSTSTMYYTVPGTGTSTYDPNAPCFTAGTLIDTDQGPVAVETLQAGDMIKTKDHGFQPVKWVGESRVVDRAVRIAAGTLGNTRDLLVSPRHKMLMDQPQLSLMFDVDQAFACASDLKNGTTITQDAEGWVTYYHILLPQHAVIYAEGAATESFYPDQGSLDGMASKTKADLLETFDPETYGPQARPTLTAVQAMWIAQNLDILNSDDMGQTAAFEATQKAAQ